MRKWVVAGLVAPMAVGVGTYLFSQPREGTVEWHKREYLRAHRELLGMPRYPQLTAFFYRVTGKGQREQVLSEGERAGLTKRLDVSRAALMEADYLVRRRIVLSNREPKDVALILMKTPPADISRDYGIFTLLSFPGEGEAKVIEVLGIANDMPKWESEARKLDVPESAK